jgi:hypothetical protein
MQRLPKPCQATPAEMIGTTRSRVSHFMNKFRELGFIDYNGTMEVHSSATATSLNDMSNLAQSLPVGGSSFGPTIGVSLRSK